MQSHSQRPSRIYAANLKDYLNRHNISIRKDQTNTYSILHFLSETVIKCLNGAMVFDGTVYITVESTAGITKGYRHNTYRTVGAAVYQIVYLFDAYEIKYDSSEIDNIFGMLIPFTGGVSSIAEILIHSTECIEADKTDIESLRTAFDSGSDSITYHPNHLLILGKKVAERQATGNRPMNIYPNPAQPPEPQYPLTRQGLIWCISKLYGLANALDRHLQTSFGELTNDQTLHGLFAHIPVLINDIKRYRDNLVLIQIVLGKESGPGKLDPNLAMDIFTACSQAQRVSVILTISELNSDAANALITTLQLVRNHFDDAEWSAAWNEPEAQKEPIS